MLPVEIRKQLVSVEEIYHDGGPRAVRPLRRAAVLSVIKNPFAHHYHREIVDFMKELEPIGLSMAQRLLTAFASDIRRIEGYGKGAIVGEAGEIERLTLARASAPTPCGRFWATPKRSPPQPRRWVASAPASMSPTSTPPISAATSMLVKLVSPTRRDEIVLVHDRRTSHSRASRRPGRYAN